MAGKGQVKFIKEVRTDEEWQESMKIPGLLVVDVHPDWSGGSQAIYSTFKKLFFQYADSKKLQFLSASHDHISALQKFRGRTHSCFLFIKDGILGESIIGSKPPVLTRTLENMAPDASGYTEGQVLENPPLAAEGKVIDPPAELIMNAIKRAPSSRGLVSSASMLSIKDVLDNIDKEKEATVPDQVEAKGVTLKIKDLTEDPTMTTQVKAEVGRNYGALHKLFAEFCTKDPSTVPAPPSAVATAPSGTDTGGDDAGKDGVSAASPATSPSKDPTPASPKESTGSIARTSSTTSVASRGAAGSSEKLHTLAWANYMALAHTYDLSTHAHVAPILKAVFCECDWERKLDMATGGEDTGPRLDSSGLPSNRLLFEEFCEALVRLSPVWEEESQVLSECVGSFLEFLLAGPPPKAAQPSADSGGVEGEGSRPGTPAGEGDGPDTDAGDTTAAAEAEAAADDASKGKGKGKGKGKAKGKGKGKGKGVSRTSSSASNARAKGKGRR